MVREQRFIRISYDYYYYYYVDDDVDDDDDDDNDDEFYSAKNLVRRYYSKRLAVNKAIWTPCSSWHVRHERRASNVSVVQLQFFLNRRPLV